MTDPPASPDEGHPPNVEIDTRLAKPARLHNYLAGGGSNFAADRTAAEYLSDPLPGGVDAARATVRVLQGFVERSVRYLAEDEGVRQFLYVGPPVPAGSEVHEIAQRIAPEARVVYVGNDPVVLAHAHALRRSTPEGAAAYVHGTLRDAAAIWQRAGATLDLAQPVAVMLIMIMSFVADELDPHGMVADLLEAAPPGSHLVLAHSTDEILSEGMPEAAKRLSESLAGPYLVRSGAEIARFFDGLDLVEPGLIQIDQWRPGPDATDATDAPDPTGGVAAPIYGAVGRTGGS